MLVSKGKKRLPSFSPSRSSAMLTRTKLNPISTTPWKRPGTTVILRVPSQNTRNSATTARRRTRIIRFISKTVPSNKMAGGKNSSIVGGENPPDSLAANWNSVSVASVNSSVSSFGAPLKARRTTCSWTLSSLADGHQSAFYPCFRQTALRVPRGRCLWVE